MSYVGFSSFPFVEVSFRALDKRAPQGRQDEVVFGDYACKADFTNEQQMVTNEQQMVK